MSQPVKLSDALVLDARIAGEAQERSIAGQVEFWAKLGRSVELLLDGQRVLSLCRSAGARPLADLIEVVDTPKGRRMFANYLEGEPFPHYEGHPTQEGLLVRVEENGTRTVGRFVNRVFVPARSRAQSSANIPRRKQVSPRVFGPGSKTPRKAALTKSKAAKPM